MPAESKAGIIVFKVLEMTLFVVDLAIPEMVIQPLFNS